LPSFAFPLGNGKENEAILQFPSLLPSIFLAVSQRVAPLPMACFFAYGTGKHLPFWKPQEKRELASLNNEKFVLNIKKKSL